MREGREKGAHHLQQVFSATIALQRRDHRDAPHSSAIPTRTLRPSEFVGDQEASADNAGSLSAERR